MARSTIALVIGICMLILIGCTPHDGTLTDSSAPFLSTKASWVDSLLNRMSVEEKVGQLLLVHAPYYYPQKREDLIRWSSEGKIGGFLQKNAPVSEFINLIKDAQSESKAPLFIASDQLVSLTNQFSDLPDYPAPASLTSISNDSVHAVLVKQMVEQFQQFGVNLCFGPHLKRTSSIDRSFDPYQLGWDEANYLHAIHSFFQPLDRNHILSVALPFDETPYLDSTFSQITPTDSTHSPGITHLVKEGLSGLLAKESIFSQPIIEELPSFYLQTYLEQQYQFGGLIFANLPHIDSLEKVLFAGTDILVVENQIDDIHQKLVQLIQDGIISQKILDQKVKKIFLAKAWTKSSPENKNIPSDQAEESISTLNHKFLAKNLLESSVILANNPNDLIPIVNPEETYQHIEAGQVTPSFKTYLAKYSDYQSTRVSTPKEFEALKLRNQQTIVTINQEVLSLSEHTQFIRQINTLSKRQAVIVVNFGSPYNLQYFDPSVVMIHAFESTADIEAYAAQLIYGGVSATGQFPLTVSDHIAEGKSENGKRIRLEFNVSPEEVGVVLAKSSTHTIKTSTVCHSAGLRAKLWCGLAKPLSKSRSKSQSKSLSESMQCPLHRPALHRLYEQTQNRTQPHGRQ